MRPRAALAGLLGVGALAVGVATSVVAADNGARARRLDRRARLCGALEVAVERLDVGVRAAEEALVRSLEGDPDALAALGAEVRR